MTYHKLKVHQIPTNTPQKELHHMDLQETIVLRIKIERGSHQATNYGPIDLQRTTHASSERHQWTWWTPPWWCLYWIWCFWNLRRLEVIFVDSPRVSGILGYLKSREAVREATEVRTTHLGAPGPPGAPWWVVLPSEHPSGTFLAHMVSSGPEKIHKKFRCVWTPFVIHFLWC